MKCVRTSVTLAAWCVTLAALWTALPVRAEQFVLIDVEYTATSANTMDSHYRVKPKAGIPGDWRSPVNYANGKVYVELQVLEKPGGSTKTLYNICIENASNPACLPYMEYSATGKYSANFDFSKFWQYAMVDWTMGCSEVSLILKDSTETKQQGDADFYPYKAHVVLTVVSPGSTYVPPGMGAAGSAAAGSGGSAGGKAGSGGSGGKGGAGGMSASSAGKGGAGGSSASSAGKGGGSASAGGKGGAGAGGSSASAGASDAGAGGSSASAGPAANSGGIGSAGTLAANQVSSERSVAGQLESTDGCSVSGKGAAGASWLLLSLLALVFRRKRS